MSSLSQIGIDFSGLGHVLSDRLLSVPVFQRSYAWEESHVRDLFSDFTEAMRQPDVEYFLGSIVLSGVKAARPEVVDGQQRLATATILIAAIRDYFEEAGDTQRADDIERAYLITRNIRTQESVPRLELNAADRGFFLDHILKRDKIPFPKKFLKSSHERLAKAAQIAAEHVQAIVKLGGDVADRLVDIIDYIETMSKVILVLVPDHANAFTIFETLNDRGLDLALADLLKNFLFGKSENRLAEVQQKWYEMIGSLEGLDSDDLIVQYIRHYWSSRNPVARERELYSKIRGSVTSKQLAVDFATELAASAKFYAAIVSSDRSFWNNYDSQAANAMDALNLMGAVQVRPLLLAILKHFSKDDVAKSMPLLVATAVRLIIVGGLGGGVLEAFYSNTATEITKKTITSAAQLLSELKKQAPSDKRFESEFAAASVSKGAFARYLLRQMEITNSGQADLVPSEDVLKVNLEHVMPENPSPAWNISEDDQKAYWRRLGNQALLNAKLNSTVGNDGFKDKKPTYALSSFTLTKELDTYADWLPLQVEERQGKLAALALKTWPLKL